MATTITIANQKGGAGKTTTTVAVAYALANLGRRVLVLDADPQGSATYWLINGAGDRKRLEHVLFDGEPIDQAVCSVAPNIDLVPTGNNLASADRHLSQEPGAEFRLSECLEPVKGAYDFILIDSPPQLSLITFNALCAADTVIIPVQASALDLNGLGRLLQTLKSLEIRLRHPLHLLGVVLTRIRTGTRIARETRELLARHELEILATVPEAVRVNEAPNAHGDFRDIGAEHPVVVAYDVLARRIIDGR